MRQDERLDAETLEQLRRVQVLASLDEEGLHCLDDARKVWVEADDLVVQQDSAMHEFVMVLEGALLYTQLGEGGESVMLFRMEAGGSLGEVSLLTNMPMPYTVRAAERSRLLRLDEEQFWRLLTVCPEVRRAILAHSAARLAKTQSNTLQQEKMASLGTMAAGLMHELNNPGSAARRAAAQLRENLLRMHRLSGKFSRMSMSGEQKECLFALQEQALCAKERVAMSSLEQSDAEEALAEWLETARVQEAWKLAPNLVAMGIDAEELGCARAAFSAEGFSDALLWLEALVSSMQLVGTIEDSIGRVSELVQAVKSYAYEGRGNQRQTIDVNRSIHATLVMLGHKLREKEIVLEKSLAADLPALHTACHGLNQVWTNLVDNAVDAAPQGGRVGVKTWAETVEGLEGKMRKDLCIAITDNGAGIPAESQAQIFDTFYTTKPAGVGTGLGLGIVQKIVEQYGGTIHFTSAPGETEFLVRLPVS